MEFSKFNYKSYEDVVSFCEENGIDLPFSKNMDILGTPVRIGKYTAPNRFAVQPMEGCDGTVDGKLGELTNRRYKRFAEGGSGLIWYEAVAVEELGRANPYQLWINDNTWEDFARSADTIRDDAMAAWGGTPLLIMQLTHSGIFSRPVPGPLQPVMGHHCAKIDERYHFTGKEPLVTDDDLKRFEDAFGKAAALAKKAGFDGIDLKGCHRYLTSGLLSAYEREGEYGGSFENRTRFFRNMVASAGANSGDMILASRMNLYDGIEEYPKAWGMDKDDFDKCDPTEPLKLIEILAKQGVSLLNITMGTPYYNPHVNRPYNSGGYHPPEHPMQGIERLMNGARVVRKSYPDMAVVATGYSWLRNYAPYLAAGMVENDWTSFAGFGRAAFAYPDLANDVLNKGSMDGNKSCIACSLCTAIMRAGATTGCPIRDQEVYKPIYQANCK